MTKRRKASAGQVIGGILADFDQKIFRTLPPTHELVHHARPDAPVPAGDGGTLTIGLPADLVPGGERHSRVAGRTVGHTALAMSTTTDTQVARAYPDWQQHNRRLVEAIRGMSETQLALRAGPKHDQIWALAAHVAGTRVFWLCGVFGEAGAAETPFTDPLTGPGWEDEPGHPRSSRELAGALEATWAVIESCLERWTLDSLEVTAERRNGDRVQVHTRASVLNRLFTHETYHVGEMSQVLGMHGFEAIDPWAKPWVRG